MVRLGLIKSCFIFTVIGLLLKSPESSIDENPSQPLPEARKALLKYLYCPSSGQINPIHNIVEIKSKSLAITPHIGEKIDRALVLWFPGPR